jgi:hypothetical protein
MDDEIPCKSIRNVESNPPFAGARGVRLPAYEPEPRRAVTYADRLPGRKPVLWSGLLQMADVSIVLFIAEQPPEAQSRLQLAIDDGGPPIRTPLAGIASWNIGVFGSIAASRIGGIADQLI